MKFARFVISSLALLLLVFTTACTKEIKVVPSDETYFAAEPSYCTTNATFTSSYTIQGDAFFEKRTITGSGLSDTIATIGIKGAEVQVLDSSGTIVQCTETDVSGHYSFTIPQSGATYTIKVLSRSYNSANKASVLDTPGSATPYYISTTFSATSNQTVADITASYANSDLRAGAFNILNNFYQANYHLINEATFTVDHKVTAYWKKGVNPVTYYGGDADSGVSFYVPGTDRLFILGGIDGDVVASDTDHYDDSVIVHEFGHFVEDNYAASDSPGGTHYGLFNIDPRLAWSEGFSTYLSTQVLGTPLYRDTVGINNGFGFYYDAENNEDIDGDPMDMPTAGRLGEGGFRELAILRFLWAATDTLVTFDELWDAYVGGFTNTLSFREMSLFLNVQDMAGGSTSLSSLLDDDDKEMSATRSAYGIEDNTLTANSAVAAECLWNINPEDPIAYISGTLASSDPFYNNDFFYLDHPGGTLQIELDNVNGSGDLDLYLYKDGYTFAVGDDLQAYSNGGTADEEINETVPAGKYMINVNYYGGTSASATNNYNLSINGDLVCR